MQAHGILIVQRTKQFEASRNNMCNGQAKKILSAIVNLQNVFDVYAQKINCFTLI